MGRQLLAQTYSPDGRGCGSHMVVIAGKAIAALDDGLYQPNADLEKMEEQAALLKDYASSLGATIRKLKAARGDIAPIGA